MKKEFKNKLFGIVCIVVWIGIWIVAAKAINSEIFLPGPLQVLGALKEMVFQREFYLSLGNTLIHILTGFFIGSILGILLATISCLSDKIRLFFEIPIRAIRAIPVASFVILALLWVDANGLVVLVTSCVTTPIIFENTFKGLRDTPEELVDAARVDRAGPLKIMCCIRLPYALNYIYPAVSVASGFAFKSGIAAEIIGLVRYSVGNELYRTKLYLETPKMFAWTVVIVLISTVTEKILRNIMSILEKNCKN